MKIKLLFPSLIVLMLSVIVPASGQDDPWLDEVLNRCRQSYERVSDYSCRLDRKELVRGEIKEQKNIIYRFKKPYSIYIEWTEGLSAGIKLIFVRGRHEDRILVHLPGIFDFVRFSVDPHGKLAMKNNRHAIDESDIGRILGIMEHDYALYKSGNGGSIMRAADENLGGRPTWFIKTEFPPDKEYYAHKININIDPELLLPVKIVAYGWNDELLEMYHFSGLSLNTGIPDQQFDLQESTSSPVKVQKVE